MAFLVISTQPPYFLLFFLFFTNNNVSFDIALPSIVVIWLFTVILAVVTLTMLQRSLYNVIAAIIIHHYSTSITAAAI